MDPSGRTDLAKKIETAVIRLLTITTACYALLVTFLCLFGIEPMIAFFFNPLSKETNATIVYNISATSRRVLQENLASLIPSNVQIISAGILGGWGTLLVPNLVASGSAALGLTSGYVIFVVSNLGIAESMSVGRLVFVTGEASVVISMLLVQLRQKQTQLRGISDATQPNMAQVPTPAFSTDNIELVVADTNTSDNQDPSQPNRIGPTTSSRTQ